MTAGRKNVVVLDYGSGNLRSAVRAVERAGAEVTPVSYTHLTLPTKRIV